MLKAKACHAKSCVATKLARATVWFVIKFRHTVSAKVWKRPRWCPERDPNTKVICMSQIRLSKDFNALSSLVRDACHSDYTERCVCRAKNLEEAALECGTRQLHVRLKQLLPSTSGRDIRLLVEDGLPTVSGFAERDVIKRFFQTKLEAEDSTLEGSLHCCR